MAACSDCGGDLGDVPLAWGPAAPLHWHLVTDSERERSHLDSDICVVDAEREGKHYYVRSVLEIPVHGRPDPFVWLVWASQSEDSFKRLGETWQTPGRENQPPTFGWLSTELRAFYGQSTVNMKTMVHQRPVGQRPTLEVEHTDHPLALEHHHGIEWSRVVEFASIAHHMNEGVAEPPR